MDTEKTRYDTPRIEDWGTVQDLTQGGRTNPGTDLHWGSVKPPRGGIN